MIKKLFIICFLFFSQLVSGQQLPAELVFYKFLKFSETYLPKQLLSSKSVVIINTPVDPQTGELGKWQELAEEAHYYFINLGIDPVRYYHTEEIMAGHDVRKAIAAELAGREVEHLVLLSSDGTDRSFTLIITEFSSDEQFIKNGQEAWFSGDVSLRLLFRNLARVIDANDLVRENLLILDTPEYIRQPDMIKGRRNPGFNTDLRIDKLAVPRFTVIPLPENLPEGAINQSFASSIQQLNKSNEQNNAELEMMFGAYPYQYLLVDYDSKEENFRAKGFQFILMMLYGTGRSIRQYLEYKDDEGKGPERLTSTMTDVNGNQIRKDLSADLPVYKFYIKHIYTGDIYLGDEWDSAPTWQEALANHLNLMLFKLKEKK